MIEELRLRGLGVIAEASLELGPGLTVLTGETGAGKTLVVTALGLLLGQRADAGLVAPRGNALVEGRLRPGDDGWVADRVADAGAELDEDGTLIVSRSLTAEGRSRAHVGGRAVPVSVLGDIGERLVQVHGQGDQQRLLRPTAQREALDAFGGSALQATRAEVAGLHARLTATAAELARLQDERSTRAARAERLRHLVAGLERLAPVEGELADLRLDIERLTHVDALREAATVARAALVGDEAEPDAVDALGLLAQARRALEGATAHDPVLAAAAEQLRGVAAVTADVGADLGAHLSGLDADPERLAAAQQRLADLGSAARERGVPLEGLPAWQAEAVAELDSLEGDDDRVQVLTAEVTALRVELGAAAGRLSAQRREAAAALQDAVTAELHELAMPHATVTCELTRRPDPDGVEVDGERVACGPHGVDETELRLAAHPGAPARPLGRGASGGELSRVMLAVEVVLAGGGVPTYLFDEVDAGVGGRAAVEVGRRLARLAGSAQVLVVTHLPQVAAFADTHLVVEKATDGRVTASGVRRLDDEGRVRELSRMLAGLEDSELAAGHAAELLATAAEAKQAVTG